jgi:TRAP-type C4-dicarboxylate transport system permease small subunit
MKKIIDGIDSIVEFIMLALTAAMVLLVSYQVFERYVLHYTPPWSEELAVYLMIWFGMIGIGVGVRRESHMALNYFADRMPKPVQKVLEYVKYILMIVYAGFIMVEGMNMVENTVNQKSPAAGFSVGYAEYLSLPVCTVLIILFAFEHLYNYITKGRNQ